MIQPIFSLSKKPIDATVWLMVLFQLGIYIGQRGKGNVCLVHGSLIRFPPSTRPSFFFLFLFLFFYEDGYLQPATPSRCYGRVCSNEKNIPIPRHSERNQQYHDVGSISLHDSKPISQRRGKPVRPAVIILTPSTRVPGNSDRAFVNGENAHPFLCQFVFHIGKPPTFASFSSYARIATDFPAM